MPCPANTLKAQWRKSAELVPSYAEWSSKLPPSKLAAITDIATRHILTIEEYRRDAMPEGKASLDGPARQRIITAELHRAHRSVATNRKVSLKQWAKDDDDGRAWLERKRHAA